MCSCLHTALGDELYTAWRARAPVTPLSGRPRRLSPDDAYRIQQRFVERRVAQGETVVGKKIGATSRAVQDLLDVRQPDFGVLLSGMHHAAGAAIPRDSLIAPRAEGEIAFLLARDLRGPGIDRHAVIAATAAVAPCFEIVDSRIRDWAIRIEDTIADNASCGVYVLGEARADPRALDLAACEMTIEKNGGPVAHGRGDAALGHPADAVAWLANALADYDVPLLAGEIVLSGSLAALIPVAAGDWLSMRIAGIGGCDVRFI
ncbi:2-oxopent-4-enoate hydratase [Burkholderia sp. FERM BP-3421]|jgi:2-oxopent-4-enoate/cis-2-oxohex-4-enoate hydratase|uniref:2-oxopent-4-enoate hydratase n=1 Tax=Burkholderia sp. FERM BP-3421 TaxID=1494466 RepID=UPI0023614730|nr:2-oxopent-4-enoate hydratase [Burkholderia sp. FERM BP-3421]WDD92173.1 2-oxopent-4-enoate hydratase [Burkholderia sp. FERM BP-3421]